MTTTFQYAVSHLLFEADRLSHEICKQANSKQSLAQCQQDLAQAVYMCLSDDITLDDYIEFATKKDREYKR